MLFKFILMCISLTTGLALPNQDIHFRNDFGISKLSIGDIATGKRTPVNEKDAKFWINSAHRVLDERLAITLNQNTAKNIVFILGDGMSSSTVTAARIHQGQMMGKTGEEETLSFEKFPWTGSSKTYCANAQVPDSACTATAYLCGVKTNIMTIGVTAKVNFNNCSESMNPKNHVSSLAAWAQLAGKSTGFVTTTTLTHASPAATYAHVANRFWECDTDVLAAQQDPLTCMDMAQQLVKNSPGRNFDVMMGGGMGKFLPNSTRDAHGNMGERTDGLNLLSLWKKMNRHEALVTTRDQLLKVDLEKTSKIMGIFASQPMDFHATANKHQQPTLEEMTEVAIKLMKKNKKGYVLFVEGGLIDYGNHANKPGISIDETEELAKAVERTVKITNHEDTLIVVTADHAHPLTISGYPERGNPILGINPNDVDQNGINYPTLNYAVGPRQYLDKHGKSINFEGEFRHLDSTHPSQIPNEIGVHSGDDVGIYATGPFAHLFSGVMEQHIIPHLMAYASNISQSPSKYDHN